MMLVQPRSTIDAQRKNTLVSALSMIGAPNGAGGYRLVWPDDEPAPQSAIGTGASRRVGVG